MRTIIWVTIVTLAASYGIFAYVTLDRQGDQAQVQSLFAQAADAVQRRDLSDAIACVSTNYKDSSGMNYDRLRMLTAQALQAEPTFVVEHSLKNLKIVDNAASVDVSLTVKASKGGSTIYKRDLTVNLTKEHTRHALIIPTTQWKVISIDGLGLDLQGGL